MDAGEIDITGIPKKDLLYALWSGQVVAGFFHGFPQQMHPGFDWVAAEKAASKGWIDYFAGKAIKADISGDSVSPRLYDRDAGQGAFAKVVSAIRKQQNQ